MSDNLQPRRPSTALTGAQRYAFRSLQAFIYKYSSRATRAAYTRALQAFFDATGWPEPASVTKEQVLAYRERLEHLRRRPRTIAQALAALRSFFDYLIAEGEIDRNPASSKLVMPPKIARTPAGRALTKKDALNLLAGMDRREVEGARDHAMLSVMLRLSLRVSEICSLRVDSIARDGSRWVLTATVKGGREERWPLPDDVKRAIDHYLVLDRERRAMLGTLDTWLFQPTKNHRTLEHDKSLSQRQVQKLVHKWADFAGLGRLTPHDLRRTCLTRMLQTFPAHKVQMVSKHKDLNTLMGYNHDRENLEENPVNFFSYDEDSPHKENVDES
jgi:integrase/recombinase XerC